MSSVDENTNTNDLTNLETNTISKSNDTNSISGKEPNPFRIPSDKEIFMLRMKEREEKQLNRNKQNSLKCWQKSKSYLGTSSTTNPNSTKSDANKITFKKNTKKNKKKEKIVMNERRKEKENMGDFIAKKREMFLVQMSLDTKRDEIRKLEEKALMKEQALLKSELMLEEDALRFDAFLKENDVKAHEAIKRHEKEVKEKQEKTQMIKRLNQEIAKVKSEMDKYQETLEYCRKYKAFLDELTPQSWFDNQKKRIEQAKIDYADYIENNKKLKERNEERNKRRKIYEAKLKEKEIKEEKKKQELLKSGGHNTTAKEEDKENQQTENADSEELIPVSDNEEELEPPKQPHEIEEEMYFKDPQQLLDIFSTLEERNLFLIQNAQETEETFDELKSKFKETKAKMEKKTQELEASINEMKLKIQKQEKKAHELKERSKLLGASGDNKQQKLLDEFGEKVSKVFSDCGFDPEQTPDTLGKLAKIEELLETLIIKLESMPETQRRKLEKQKEAERRDRLRREKVEKLEKEYELRLKRSLERAKRVEQRVLQQRRGKPTMFRSAPIKKKKKKQSSTSRKKEEQERIFKKFFT